MSQDSLWNLSPARQARVKTIIDTCPELFKSRLGDLGFYPGERIICLRKTPFGGPRVYQVGHSVFALAQDIASFVLISEI
jgi:Fe2+ transport system protein FeoA